MIDRLLNSIGLERRNHSLGQFSPELLALFGGQPTASGVAVTAQTALRSPTTLAVCRTLAETLASLPIHLFARGADGARTRESDHPAARLLGGDWTPWSGQVEIRTAMMFDSLLHGAAFGQVIRAGERPMEIHRLDPSQTTLDTTGPEPRFKTKANGIERILDWRDVLYVPTPGSTPGRVLCLIDLCREAIGLDMAMSQHQGRIFSRGARPSGVLKTGKNKISLEKLAFLKAQFNASDDKGGTLVLEDEWDFKQTQFSSVDMQFMDLRRFAIQEIARAFKVPATLIGDMDRATWRNVEELARQFLQYTLLPWMEVWKAAIERVLLTPAERERLFCEFIVDDLVRADLAARHVAFRQAAGGAWLTPNEIRAMENRPPIDGGDELIRQAGQAGAEDAIPSPTPLKAVA